MRHHKDLLYFRRFAITSCLANEHMQK